MPYDEKLADRTRRALAGTPGLTEKKMFGGLCFLVGGNMCFGITGDTLLAEWAGRGAAFASSLPPKPLKKKSS